MKFDLLIRVPIHEDNYDQASDGQEERWQPVRICLDCGDLFALEERDAWQH